MTNRMRHGKRFGPTRYEYLMPKMMPYDSDLAKAMLVRRGKKRPPAEVVRGAQTRSVGSRAKRGLGVPSMPAFEFERGQQVIPPKDEDWRSKACRLAGKLCRGEIVGVELAGDSCVTVTLKRGKREIDACIDLVAEKVIYEIG